MIREYVDEMPTNLNSSSQMDKYFNKRIVEWDQYYSYVNLPIGCVSGLLYGAYGDNHGRKLNLMIGIGSVAVDNAITMFVWSRSVNAPLYFLLISAAVSAAMGNFFLVMSSVNAFLADMFPDKKEMGMRMVFVSVVFSVGGLLGSLGAGYFSRLLSNIVVVAFAQFLILIALLYSLIFLKQIPPKRTSLIPPPEQRRPLWRRSLSYVIDTCKVFLRKRDGHRRAFLWLSVVAGFVDDAVFSEETHLVGTYTLLLPFKWDSSKLGVYTSIRSIIQVVGMAIGMIVFGKLLKLRNTTLIIISITSMSAACAVIGLANSDAMIFASLPAGMFHGLLNPLTLTFVSCLVEPDEVGKAYATTMVASKVAGLAQSAALQSIYRATIDWYQGFTWLLIAGIGLLSALAYLWVYFKAKAEGIGEGNSADAVIERRLSISAAHS
uniref:Major facilitator superfamily (MFS) profile domain-containing protein n=1 Tax=Plectus sambesii TaxID=2011161 RepID=A0A914W1Q4_9BILA